MASRPQIFTTITTEGALLPPDLLQRITESDADLEGLRPSDYFLLPGERLNEAISHAWTRLQGAWVAFRNDRERLADDDPGTTLTRNKWLLPLFHVLEYGQLDFVASLAVDGRDYAISHRSPDGRVPLHLMGCNVPIDRRTPGLPGAATASPHSTLQVFLNRSEDHLWGIVSNGLRLRLLRDNVSLTRQAYIEFDVEAMMEGEVYADFVLLYLLLHKSRFAADRPAEFWIERWRQVAIEQGTRALDQLRDEVERAIAHLGAGFIAHPHNADLRAKLAAGELNKQDYYRQMLRLVYRLLFLFTAEDRNLLRDPAAPDAAYAIYSENYSTRRLRTLAENFRGTRHHDAYEGLRIVMRLLGGEREDAHLLGLPVLDGFLFRDEAVPDIIDAHINNVDLLEAVRALAFIEDRQVKALRPVDYKNLGPEELGSVYESLLELHPELNLDARTFNLTTAAGHERKTTGSYYTPDSLVQELLNSALEPVLEEAKNSDDPEGAILDLKVCDPATGSGHFLIAAAHRMARALAQVRTYEEEPPPDAIQAALRDVIGRCIYGVDINPMAVELCKVSLWMEALEPGKPLTFLDHRIKVGNSLLGTTPRLMANGIPVDAFPTKSGLLEGDDYGLVRDLRRKNREELAALLDPASGVQMALFTEASLSTGHEHLAMGVREIDAIADDTPQGVQAQANAYRQLQESYEYQRQRFLADLWCAAFVWRKTPDNALPPTSLVYDRLVRADDLWAFPGVDAMAEEVHYLAGGYQFFHWHIEFPDVFDVPEDVSDAENEQAGWNDGFDCVLGNPPWERVQLEEKQFFSGIRPDIVSARSRERKKLIRDLREEDPQLFAEWQLEARYVLGQSHWIRYSETYPLAGSGNINTYAIFTELSLSLINSSGRVGLIVPSGILTEGSHQDFAQSLLSSNQVIAALDFENRAKNFGDVDSRFHYSLLTLRAPNKQQAETIFAFFLHQVSDLTNEEKIIPFFEGDVALINPNSLTIPPIRYRRDAELLLKIHQSAPILHNEEIDKNPWKFDSKQMINAAHDSDDFVEPTSSILNAMSIWGVSYSNDEALIRLYDGKMVDQFNHRLASVSYNATATFRTTDSEPTSLKQYKDPSYLPAAQYWIPEERVRRAQPKYHHARLWMITFRAVTASTNWRTVISAFVPHCGLIHAVPALYSEYDASSQCLLLASLNSFVLDYSARLKVSGTHLSHFIIKQLPILPPHTYSLDLRNFVISRVLELSYTAWDLEPLAHDVGWDSPPFVWDDERRFLMRCELDALYFHLYQIARDDVDYIMETFPIVKRKDEEAHGHYRTKDTILAMYDEMAALPKVSVPHPKGLDEDYLVPDVSQYEAWLSPGPADPRVAHPDTRE